MRRLGVISLIVFMLLALAASAQAAQRFATPKGSGEACTQGAPCGLETALGKAKEGDEVIIGAGTYATTKGFEPEDFEVDGLYVHGDFGGPMPRIEASLNGSEGFTAIALIGASSRLAYLEVSLTGNPPGEEGGLTGVYCGGGLVERVRVVSQGAASVGFIAAGACSVSNSVAWMQGSDSRGLLASGGVGNVTANLHNATLIGSGPNSVGAVASTIPLFIEESTTTLNIVNSIVSGTEFDLRVREGEEGPGKMVVSHSNFRTAKGEKKATIANAGANQTAPPLFVNAAAGDFREAVGSPTIDAGVVDPLIGATEFAGGPRVVGSTVDIGAYEFTPPPPPAAAPKSGPKPKGTLKLRGGTNLTVGRKGQVSIRLTCSAAGPCRGKLALVTLTGKATISADKPKKATTLARKSYSLAAGTKKSIVLTLKGKALRKARSKRGLHARLAIKPAGGKLKLRKVTLHSKS